MLYFPFRVAIDTPRHFHCRYTGNAVHRLYRAVAFLAREPRLDMPLMRKVYIVRKIVNLDPWNGLTIFPISGELQNLRALANSRKRFMTTDTFANAGYAGNRRPVGIDVAMLARNFIIRGMYLVTEFDGLDRTSIREIFSVYPCADEQADDQHKHKQGWLLRGL